jgi:RimJ/RimL family protein N-acetyltransferase
MRPIPNLAEPLDDGAVRLRPYAESDIPEILIAYEDDPTLHERLGEARPPSGAELGAESERAESDWKGGSRAALTILAPGDDVCVGRLIADRIDWDHRHCDLHVWVARQHRRRGLGGAALRLAAGWIFTVWNLERVAVLVDPENHAMLACARASGFVPEGTLRGYLVRPGRQGAGERRDAVSLSLLPVDLE